MLKSYICALDIGSSKVACAVAEIKRKRITNVFLEDLAAKGIKKGVIIDSIDLVDSVSRALKNLKAKSGINIKSVYTNLSGKDIITKHSHAIIPLAEKGSKIITQADIQKVNEQARILGLNLEEEIIHQIPISYSTDSNNHILNPLGLYSHRLEVDLYLVCGKLSSIQSLTRIINQAGYEIKDLFFSGIATSIAIFDKGPKEDISILCDIGSDITELLIFKAGGLKDIEILSIGSNDLTEELSKALRIPFNLAEDVKRSHGIIGDYVQIEENKEILIKKDNIYKPIKQRLVSEILTSKADLICKTLKDKIEKIVSCDEINNFITSGRSLLLEGLLERLENILGISVKLARIMHPDIIYLLNKNNDMTGQKYLTYLTALGIICQALRHQSQSLYSTRPIHNPLLNIINKVKEIYQEYF